MKRRLLACALVLPTALALADASVGPGKKQTPFRPPLPPPRYCKLMFAPPEHDQSLEHVAEADLRKMKAELVRFARPKVHVLAARDRNTLYVLAFDYEKPGASVMSFDLAAGTVRWTREIAKFPEQPGWPPTPHAVRIAIAWRQDQHLVQLTNYDQQGCFDVLVDATTGTPEEARRRIYP
jgi:hypothetical protein